MSMGADEGSLIRCAVRLLWKTGGFHARAAVLLNEVLSEPEVLEAFPCSAAEVLICYIELGMDVGAESHVRTF
jgi:hypothetical protein